MIRIMIFKSLRKIHWIDNSSWILEKKVWKYSEKFENLNKFFKFIKFENLKKYVKIWKIYSNFQVFQKKFDFFFNTEQVIIYPTYFSKLYFDQHYGDRSTVFTDKIQSQSGINNYFHTFNIPYSHMGQSYQDGNLGLIVSVFCRWKQYSCLHNLGPNRVSKSRFDR